MDDLIRREQPKFMIANVCGLDLPRPWTDDPQECQYWLFREDFEALKANFVHHWGLVYVAGKAFDLTVPTEPQRFEILVSGTYTLEADAAAVIDGATYRPGEQIHLDQGMHRIAESHAATRAVLRFGADLHRPSLKPSPQPVYYRF